MGGRQFLALTGMMLTSAAREWLFDLVWVVVFLHGKRIGHELIDDLERVVETKRHGDDAIGGGTAAVGAGGRAIGRVHAA
ncbi:MAG TPA: hypothetical protein VK784_03435 [Pseudonocardiaceae bacterium]|nr:hypothetical protein [Pseudonocardiaceae bacterium]